MRTTVLIIGLGQIGMGYDLELDTAEYVYSHARAFSLHPNFELIGAVDINAESRQVFESIYQCSTFTSIESALNQISPQYVVIATPTQFHCENLYEIIEKSRAKPKIIICEKPLSYSLQESESMVEACEQNNIELYVNYMRVSEPGVAEIKKRLQNNVIQSPVKGTVWYSKGFLHNGSHFFNLIEYLLGDVVDIKIIQTGRGLAEGDAEPDVLVKFELGDIIFLAAQEENYSYHKIELIAPNGRLLYENGGRKITWNSVTPSHELKGYSFLSEKVEPISSELNRYQWYVADELNKSMSGLKVALCSGRQALHTLENMQLILGKR